MAQRLSALPRALTALRHRLRDLRPVLEPHAESLRTSIDSGFRASQDPWGGGWKPLAPATIARRRKGSSKPLVDTRALRRSVHARATRQSVFFGVSGAAATYAPTHQMGAEDVPRRAFLPLDLSKKPDFSRGRAQRWYKRMLRDVGRHLKGKR